MQGKDDPGTHKTDKDIGAVYTSPSFQIIDTSSEVLDILGFDSPDEMVGLDFIRHFILDTEEQERILDKIDRDKQYNSIILLERKDGTTTSVFVRVFTLYDEDRHVTGYQFTLFPPEQESEHFDKTSAEPAPEENKETESAPRSDFAFKGIVQILDSVPYPLMVVDDNNYICVWNRMLEEVTGIPVRSVLDTDFVHLLMDSSFGIWQKSTDCIREKFQEQCETEKPVQIIDRHGNILQSYLILKRNEILGKSFISVSFHDWEKKTSADFKDGQVVREMIDIEPPPQIEVLRPVSTRFAQKLEEIGRALKTETDPDSKLQDIIDKVFFAARQLFYFGGMESSAKTDIELNRLIKKYLATLGSTGLQIRLRLDDKVPAIYGDPEQITHALQICLQNALDEVTKPHGIEISTRMIEEAGGGKFVCLQIADNGKGFAPEIFDRIFTPFTTTKADSGTGGLGLAALYGIVKAHKGRVEIKSGDGACILLFFPAAEKSISAAHTPEKSKTTVLLMDDDEVIIDVNKTVLAHSGYNVLTALSVKEGLRQLQERYREIAMVMIDGSLRGCEDGELVKKIRHIVTDMPVVISSGYQKERFLNVLNTFQCGWLQKPHTSDELCKIVRAFVNCY
ncbi:PAS domain-containing protein [candidate division KSB1 bacterium]|nr:PAS domain-containing protein [candidate division KSB1 bacterium]